jgi:S1-C subfamily serine protease
MEQLITNGRVIRPWIGVVYGGDVDAQSAQAYNLGTDHGVIVREVEPGGPASQAGVEPRDIITTLDGQRVESWNDFVHDIVTRKIGEKVHLGIVRDGVSRTLTVTLAERPAESR